MRQSDSEELPEVRTVSLWEERKSVFHADGHEIILWMSAWSGREIVALDGQRVSDLRSLTGGVHQFEHDGHRYRVEATTESVWEGIQRVELYRDGERVGVDRIRIDDGTQGLDDSAGNRFSEGRSADPEVAETSAPKPPEPKRPGPNRREDAPQPGPSLTHSGDLVPPSSPRDLVPESVGVRPGRPGERAPGRAPSPVSWLLPVLLVAMLLLLAWLWTG